MKQSVTRLTRVRMWTAVAVVALGAVAGTSVARSLPMAQARAEEVRARRGDHRGRPRRVQGRPADGARAGPRLPRSHRGVRQERPEDQLGHHHQPEGARGSRRARRRLQEVGPGRSAARHPRGPEGPDGRRRHADDARLGRVQGHRADARRVRHREAEEGRRDHPRQGDARRDGRRRFVRLALRRLAQSLRSRAHGRRILRRHGRGGGGELRDHRRRPGRASPRSAVPPPGTASSACGRRPAW